jgi:cytochrome P450
VTTAADTGHGGHDGNADELDPFDAFNRAMGAGVVEDPYPGFVSARAQGPIYGGSGVTLDGETADQTLPEGLPGLYTAYSFEAVQEVLRDSEHFSSSAYSMVMGPVMGRSILEMDEPEHHAYRALLQQAFTRKAMERWETELVAPVVNGLIDRFIADGRAELVRSLHFPFPMTVIAALLGLPDELLDDFHRLGVELIAVSVDQQRALAASHKLGELFSEQIERRRRQPADDMITVLCQAEHDGQRLTDEEILAFLRLLLPAGAETTYRSSSNLMCGLLTHPDQLDALRRDRTLLPQAIEEGLRWECPLLMIVRTAVRDTEVCGVPIPAGSVVLANIGSANRDESRWDHPERFDIFREPKAHLAFAAGPHTCLGMHLARMETAVVVNALLDRLPNLRLDPDQEPPQITGLTFRSPSALHVVWDV